MFSWEQEISDFNKSLEEGSNLGADSHYLEDREIVKSVIAENLEISDNSEEFLKGFGKDLEKKFPNGGWRTINGAKVFVNGGKVVAGLNGFNDHIDKFFDGKKKEGDGKLKGNVGKQKQKVADLESKLLDEKEKENKKFADRGFGYAQRHSKLGNAYSKRGESLREKLKEEQEKLDGMLGNKPKEITKEEFETKYGKLDNQPNKQESKKEEKPVNERNAAEIGTAKQKIADTMPKPINKMTWEEFKPYGVKMQKESSHSQPDSWYERQAKYEHDWAIKNNKSQYDTSKIKGDSKKENKTFEDFSSTSQIFFDSAKKRYPNLNKDKVLEYAEKIFKNDGDKERKTEHVAEAIMYAEGESHADDYFEDKDQEFKVAKRAVEGQSGLENAQRIIDMGIGGNLEKKAKELISVFSNIKEKSKNLDSTAKTLFKTGIEKLALPLDKVSQMVNELKGNKPEDVAEVINRIGFASQEPMSSKKKSSPINKQSDKEFLSGDWKWGGTRQSVVDSWTKQAIGEIGKGKKFKTKDDAKKEVLKMAKNINGIDDERYRVLKIVASKL